MVESPCNGICSLSDERTCIGCGRTIDEIAGWSSMNHFAKRQVVDNAARRLALQNAPTTKTGFTLMELLVVIGIVGVLVSLLLPAKGSGVQNSRLSKFFSFVMT
jgi:prepilin-type N-terminal cleavage/methylation domain-containing protein